MKKNTSSSKKSQGSRGNSGNRGNRRNSGSSGSRGGQGRSQSEDQRGPPEPRMPESSMEDNRERLAGMAAQALNLSEHPASAPSGPQASHVQSQPGRRQGSRISVEDLLHHDTHHRGAPPTSQPRAPIPVRNHITADQEPRAHQRAALPTSQPGVPMAMGNLITAEPEPMDHLTSTTRNMSIAAIPAHAPSGVGPSIGGYGEQHRSTLGPGPSPGPAQPLQQSQSKRVRKKPSLARQSCDPCYDAGEDCDRKKPCTNCVSNKRSCVHPLKIRELQTCDHCKTHKHGDCDGARPTCGRCAREKVKCHYSAPKKRVSGEAEEASRGHPEPAPKKRGSWEAKQASVGHPEPAGNVRRRINFDDLVPDVRILRPITGKKVPIYRNAPLGVFPPPGVALDRIIGWDRLEGIAPPGSQGVWVIRPESRDGLLPHELGSNTVGHMAIKVDGHEGAGEMGGMMDMRTAATGSRPPAQPQGFDVAGPSAAAHSVQTHSLAGRVHRRGSTESPPADDHHDQAKRQRRPPQN
ncbi:hypothetical protein NA56DRAFT_712304 [Hyaloscypha hepaticicola]|uniref:Zn(2)-C6 fungal-type domain-containing protein n=1 Tax=Hyaloscypha hepaticicola TaxID=2082293 RepID=A0A2J6PGI1_9HELO|nr:hypothetical protein NA56DRAFT_712304 [Hyaloscypha hepaticicola]